MGQRSTGSESLIPDSLNCCRLPVSTSIQRHGASTGSGQMQCFEPINPITRDLFDTLHISTNSPSPLPRNNLPRVARYPLSKTDRKKRLVDHRGQISPFSIVVQNSYRARALIGVLQQKRQVIRDYMTLAGFRAWINDSDLIGSWATLVKVAMKFWARPTILQLWKCQFELIRQRLNLMSPVSRQISSLQAEADHCGTHLTHDGAFLRANSCSTMSFGYSYSAKRRPSLIERHSKCSKFVPCRTVSM